MRSSIPEVNDICAKTIPEVRALKINIKNFNFIVNNLIFEILILSVT
jgi:hypothetical protein